MKWKDDRVGDCRVKKWFALLPVKIEDETRWFETVEVVQRYRKLVHPQCYPVFEWFNVKFLNEYEMGRS